MSNIFLKENVILTDVDGVLLDWNVSFNSWMALRGYDLLDESAYGAVKAYGLTQKEKMRIVREFNESAYMGWLPPLRDSIKYVKKLHEEHGFLFRAITSMSLNPYARKLRIMNLERLFGASVFEEVICLDTGANKDDELKKYEGTGCWWIEDKIDNAYLGKTFGLNSILVGHDYNVNYLVDPMWKGLTDDIPRYWDWKDIYTHIVNHGNT